ncbi:MAG TPA: hypothetical protein VFY80_02020, partial [Burkholderiales bacterium]|nr:hypothetical protein [Burkholderiales bacterium]
MTDTLKAARKRARTKSYPGSLTRRGDSWRLRLCVGGEYHSFTVAGTKLEAQNFAVQKHAALTAELRRAVAGLPGPLRFSALLDEYERYELPTRSAGTQKSYKSSFVAFREFFGGELRDPFVRDIRRSHVQTFLEWRRTYRIRTDHDVSGHTVARDRRVLHRLFNYGVAKDHLDANPCALVRAPKADPRTPPILSPEQLDKLLAACDSNPMLRLYVLLLAETGLRA